MIFCHAHSPSFCEQYFGKSGSALSPNCTKRLRNTDIRVNISLGTDSTSKSAGGSDQSLQKIVSSAIKSRNELSILLFAYLSATADARGHKRPSRIFSSTCSDHRQASPPRIYQISWLLLDVLFRKGWQVWITCFNLNDSKRISSHGRCLYALCHVVYGLHAPLPTKTKSFRLILSIGQQLYRMKNTCRPPTAETAI